MMVINGYYQILFNLYFFNCYYIMNYKAKYLKYKLKYCKLKMKENKGGAAAAGLPSTTAVTLEPEYLGVDEIGAAALGPDQIQDEESISVAEKYHDFIILDLEFKKEFKDNFIEKSINYNKLRSLNKNDSLEELIQILPEDINQVFNINTLRFRINSINDVKDLSISSLYNLIKTKNYKIINLSQKDLNAEIKSNIIGDFNNFIGAVNIMKNSPEYGLNKFFYYELQNKLLMPGNIFDSQILSKNQQIEINKNVESFYNWCLLPNETLNNGNTCIIYMNISNDMMYNYSQQAKSDASSMLIKNYLFERILKVNAFDRGDEIMIDSWIEHEWNRLPEISKYFDIPDAPNIRLTKIGNNLILY